MDEPPPAYEAKAQAGIFSASTAASTSTSTSTQNTNAKAKSHIVRLKHCKPGRFSKRGKLLTGGLIEEITDAITIPNNVQFHDLAKILIDRVEKRFEILLYRDGLDRSAIVMKVDGSAVNVVDQSSWEAARQVLWDGKGKVKLEYYFAQVPDGWTGVEKTTSKCVVQ